MIFVGLLAMLVCLVTAYRSQNVPVVHLSLVKSSMSQIFFFSIYVYICGKQKLDKRAHQYNRQQNSFSYVFKPYINNSKADEQSMDYLRSVEFFLMHNYLFL